MSFIVTIPEPATILFILHGFRYKSNGIPLIQFATSQRFKPVLYNLAFLKWDGFIFQDHR